MRRCSATLAFRGEGRFLHNFACLHTRTQGQDEQGRFQAQRKRGWEIPTLAFSKRDNYNEIRITNTEPLENILPGGVLLIVLAIIVLLIYIISPLDILPDIFGPIGRLDDLLLTGFFRLLGS